MHFAAVLFYARDYFNSNIDRQADGTDYAVSNTSWRLYNFWWLRSPGGRNNFAATVQGNGNIDKIGIPVGSDVYGVRPAMWIDIRKL